MKTTRDRVQVTTQQAIVMRREDVVLKEKAKICYGVFQECHNKRRVKKQTTIRVQNTFIFFLTY